MIHFSSRVNKNALYCILMQKPLIVQSDKTMLLDVHSPLANECRSELIAFAELEKSPEHIHTYRLSPLSLWNAASADLQSEAIIATLEKFSAFAVPESIAVWICETMARFGKVHIRETKNENELLLTVDSGRIFSELQKNRELQKYFLDKTPSEKNAFLFKVTNRGTIKQTLLTLGYPAKDEAHLIEGDTLSFTLRSKTKSGKPFVVRDYQKAASESFLGNKKAGSGFGTIVLPCGSGKTIVALEIMEKLQTNTLIVTTNISAVHQWIQELLDKTSLTSDDIAEYSGEAKTIKPVTIATYQILTWRANKDSDYPHFSLFRKRNWGFIIYDEVHTLPAPVFRVAAELQAIRRVGLTATLVREDGNEGAVFSLVGPKRFDVPWKELEKYGWIAKAECVEVKVDFNDDDEITYATSPLRKKHRLASENQNKYEIVKTLLSLYKDESILVIGQYISQLEKIAQKIAAPIITGKTPIAERDALYEKFRAGNLHALVVSKVANFAIDLPDASVAIQVSGTFGSRQEEAQRLGRILRPKEKCAKFFTLITRDSVEEEFGANRQKFLAEQGYSYHLISYAGAKNFQNALLILDEK